MKTERLSPSIGTERCAFNSVGNGKPSACLEKGKRKEGGACERWGSGNAAEKGKESLEVKSLRQTSSNSIDVESLRQPSYAKVSTLVPERNSPDQNFHSGQAAVLHPLMDSAPSGESATNGRASAFPSLVPDLHRNGATSDQYASLTGRQEKDGTGMASCKPESTVSEREQSVFSTKRAEEEEYCRGLQRSLSQKPPPSDGENFKAREKMLSRSTTISNHELSRDSENRSRFRYFRPGRSATENNEVSRLDSDMRQSAIVRAMVAGSHKLVLECIKQGENPRLVCKNTGRSYVHVIVCSASQDRELSWVPMVYQMSNAGLDMSLLDDLGHSALSLAINRKLVQLVAALLKCGSDITDADIFQAEQIRGVVKSELMEIIRRLTPSYWMAVHDLTPFKVNRLVKAWSRVNLTRDGQTLIEYAKHHARDDKVVRLLLQHEASIELAHAVMAGDADRARVYMCHGSVDLDTCDTSVKHNFFEPYAPLTLSGAALKLGHTDLLQTLKTGQARSKYLTGYSVSDCSNTSNGASFPTRHTVFYYRGADNEEKCEIRQKTKPATSAVCVIL